MVIFIRFCKAAGIIKNKQGNGYFIAKYLSIYYFCTFMLFLSTFESPTLQYVHTVYIKVHVNLHIRMHQFPPTSGKEWPPRKE